MTSRELSSSIEVLSYPINRKQIQEFLVKTRYDLSSRVWLLAVLILSVFLSANVYATTHIVTFTCCSYTPSNFEASVGDTVIWQGTFADHPLESTTIPPGAASFSRSTGTSFSYVIQVPGVYNYHCVFHQPSMAGSFNATLVGVNDETALKPEVFQLYQNFPNPFNPRTEIRYQISEVSHVTLKVFSVVGNEVATLVNEKKSPGIYSVEFNEAKLASGVYLYQLQSGSFSETKKLILMK